MDRKGILVTGGAGYIGSHVVKQLGAASEPVVVVDNLSTGFRTAVTHGTLVVGDIGDEKLVDRILAEYDIGTIMHFAANTVVPESVANPLKYYANNTCSSLSLLRSAIRHGVADFVFSSTAAVYGRPETGLASEDTPMAPINPYGASKLMAEWVLRDVAAASGLRFITLRYFNVAGSDPGGRIGQCTPRATLLTKVACEAAVGKRNHVSIFGTDYDTPDGTGIRDYIHVEDLATAHVQALKYLRDGGESAVLNCGYGHGYSVREVLAAVQRISDRPLVIREEPRRAGDPPKLVAVAKRIRQVLGWRPQYDDLDFIIRTSLAWEKRLLTHPME